MSQNLTGYKIMRQRFNLSINQYLLAILIVGAVVLACTPLASTQNYHIVSFILLFVVSIISTFMGMGPVLLAASLSALVWNFFFIPPHFTFHIDRTVDILTFGLFFIIALTNAVLTTRIRRQEQLAREREQKTNALFQLTKQLSKSGGIEEVLRISREEIKNYFGLEPVFILQNGQNQLIDQRSKRINTEITPPELHVAEWCFANGHKAGAYTQETFASRYTYFPLTGTRLNPGVVAVRLDKSFPVDQNSFWDTFLAQISNALEREFLGELAQKVRLLDESGRLYKTLFNSISHELRIPVATIMGAADTLINSEGSGNIQTALGFEIFTASIRLNRLIENLLNMSRLESGHITLRLDWYDINDLINRVTDTLKDELKPFTIRIDIPDDMPLVILDFGLMEQVLYNLLYNATQYAPAATEIGIRTWHENEKCCIEISDQGPGFPEAELNHVFRKFYRADDKKTGGLGLGLSIVKGYIEAHKGTIHVENRESGGAVFTIRIPSRQPDMNQIPREDE